MVSFATLYKETGSNFQAMGYHGYAQVTDRHERIQEIQK